MARMVVHFKVRWEVWLVIIVEKEGCVEAVRLMGLKVGPKEVVLAGLEVGPNGVGLSSRAWGGGKLSLLEWGVLGVKVCEMMVDFVVRWEVWLS